jgi:SulP family sulfate permease
VSIAARALALLPRRADWTAATRSPGRDVLAGVTVALVALPLALAFGETSGLGAQAGLVTAVVAGALAAVFGGSNLQVSGPTGAMTVVLVPVVQRFGVEAVPMVGLMAGIVLVGLAVVRFGGFVRYLPVPVIEGFTAGIAVVIGLQQVPAALGIAHAHGAKVWQVAYHAAADFAIHPRVGPLVIAVAVAGCILLGSRRWPSVPFSLVATGAATLVVWLSSANVALLGTLPHRLPSPSFGFFDPGTVRALLPSAFAVAALAALESLLSATVADGMTVNQHHDPNRELFGQGIANLVVPLFGGIPATGAIARTAVNVRAGGSSKLAALVHALVLAAVIYTVAPLVSLIPLAALAGVLLATAVRMVELASLRALARSTRGDAAVLALTFSVTVFVDLVTAVVVGVGVAILLALREIVRSVSVDEVPIEEHNHAEEEHRLLAEHIVAYRLDGPLFFAAAHHFLLELTNLAYVRVVILRMSRVSTIDATGARMLGDAVTQLERRGIVVLLSGISTQHDEVLNALGVADHLRRGGLIFPDTPSAIAHARTIAGEERPHATTALRPPALTGV